MHLRRVVENGQIPLKASTHEKVVYFIRHGQSLANTVWGEGNAKFDPSLRDSPLTEKGKSQARRLQNVVGGLDVQLIISSPLTRTLQTACLAFENESTPIIAWPLVTEFFPELPECHGRNKHELEKDERLTSLPRFGQVHLDNVVDEWWGCAGDETRVESLLSWLRHCPETRIAVVCHWGFIYGVMRAARCGQPLEVENCALVASLWHPERPEPNITAGMVTPLEQPAPPPPVEYAAWLVPDATRPSPLLEEIQRLHAASRADPRVRSAASLLPERGGGRLHIALSDFVPMRYDALHVLCSALRCAAGHVAAADGARFAWRPQPASVAVVGMGGMGSNGGTSSGSGSGSDAEEDSPGAAAADDAAAAGKGMHARITFRSDTLASLAAQLRAIRAFTEDSAAVRGPELFGMTLLQDINPAGVSVRPNDVARLLAGGRFPLLSKCMGVDADGGGSCGNGESGNARSGDCGELRDQFCALRWLVCVVGRENSEVRPEPGMVFPLFSLP